MPASRSHDYVTESGDDTVRLGRELAARMRAPLLVLLIGNLGAGKTTLAKGMAAGLGAAGEDDVTSPSFTLIHEYGPGPNRVFHVDLYRLEGRREIATLGLEDVLDPARPAVVLIEWGEKLEGLFPGPRWEIHLDDCGGERRRIRVEEFDA